MEREKEREWESEKETNKKERGLIWGKINFDYLAWLKQHFKQWMYVLKLLSEGLQSQVFSPQGLFT